MKNFLDKTESKTISREASLFTSLRFSFCSDRILLSHLHLLASPTGVRMSAKVSAEEIEEIREGFKKVGELRSMPCGHHLHIDSLFSSNLLITQQIEVAYKWKKSNNCEKKITTKY